MKALTAFFCKEITKVWLLYVIVLGSNNGLLSDGTKSLSEPMLTNHQRNPVSFIKVKFNSKYWRHLSILWVWILSIQNPVAFTRANGWKPLTNPSEWRPTKPAIYICVCIVHNPQWIVVHFTFHNILIVILNSQEVPIPIWLLATGLWLGHWLALFRQDGMGMTTILNPWSRVMPFWKS